MSKLENEKLSTQKFLEDAVDGARIEHVPLEESHNESQKLIMDEISNEKVPTSDVADARETQSLLESTESLKESEIDDSDDIELDRPEDREAILSLSEETESARDLKSSERDLSDDEEQTAEPPKVEWQDLLGSGIVMKKILKEGQPDTRPLRSDLCLVNYTCRLEDADEQDFAEKVENYELSLGEGDVVQGLDVALGLMNKNERCLLKIGSRLAYGDKGLTPKIPANATVMFDVELIDVRQESDIESLSIQDRRKMGNKKRERGNWWYQRGENTLAIQCYRRALDFLDEVETENTEHQKPSDSDLQQLLEDRLKVLNNMASAQIKMELYDQALTSLQTVLRCQPDNVKALFRKAKIHQAKNELLQALKLLEKAKSLEPEDTLIAKEVSTVNGLITKQKNSEREYARRMFGGASSNPSKTSKETKKITDSKLQIWATIGATLFVGIAGLIAYKFKYP